MGEERDKRIQELVDAITRMVATKEPYDTFSFLQGIEAFVQMFGIWKNGAITFGVDEYTSRELAEAFVKYNEAQR